MLKKLILTGLTLVSLSGCSVLVDMRGQATQFDMPVVQAKLESSPVKSSRFASVQTIVVADVSPLMGSEMPKDNKRLYKVAVKELETQLKASGKYQVLSTQAFRKKLLELGTDIDFSASSEQEVQTALAEVGRELNVQAVASFGMELVGNPASLSNQLKGIGSYLMDGEFKLDAIVNVDVVASKDAQLLYLQRNKVQWVQGSQGLHTTSTKDLRVKLAKVIVPMLP